MKKEEIYNKLKTQGVLPSHFTFNEVNFTMPKEITLSGYYKPYGSGMHGYTTWEHYFVVNEDITKHAKLPFFTAHSYNDNIKTVADVDIKNALNNVDFNIKYIVRVKRYETVRGARYSATVMESVEKILAKYK